MAEGKLRGCLNISEGRHGILLTPYLHPELYDSVEDIIAQALSLLPEKRVYIRLMAHQAWMRHALEANLGFQEALQQALMARHTVVLKEAAAPAVALEHKSLAPVLDIAWEVSA